MEEKTVWSGTSSQVINFWLYVLCGLVFVALLTVLILLWPNVKDLGLAVQIPVFLLLLSPLFYALDRAVLVKSIRYEITSERIKVNSGIFSRKTNAMELYRVKDYTLVAPFFYRLFHLGNIYITTSDHSTPQIALKAIPHAQKLMDDIRTYVEMRRDLKRVREVDFDQVADTAGH